MVLANQARNWLVTSSLDSLTTPTVGSLRWAVNNAQNNDVITFALASYPAVIRLKSVNGPLIRSKHVSIKGPGADQLTITGDSNSNGQTDSNDVQLFKVYASVTIDSLTLTRGYATNGGAISVATNPASIAGQSAGSLRLLNCTISDCKAADWGGAVDVEEGSLEVQNSLFRGNSVSSSSGLGGGAVSLYTSQPCSFTNSTFSANVQAAAAGYGGGAIYVENFDPVALFETDVIHCTFAQNVDASTQGTSICANVFNAYVNVANSIFADSTVGLATSRNLYATGDAWILSGMKARSTSFAATNIRDCGHGARHSIWASCSLREC